MKPILIVGKSGRMSLSLQEILHRQQRPFCLHSRAEPLTKFDGLAGIIDFSLPESLEEVAALARHAKLPWVCGTTGFEDMTKIKSQFEAWAQEIPILWDSNFSQGIERLCQMASHLAQKYPRAPIEIVDIHHVHKKDSPSGTALKIEKRILEASPQSQINIKSRREGDIFGIHSVQVSLAEETLTLSHQAESRSLFAHGALQALDWLVRQKNGFYTLRDFAR